MNTFGYGFFDAFADRPITFYKSSIPKPVRVDKNGTATVVHWEDGTYTAVNMCPTDEDNVYAAFCAALAKKIYGSTSTVHKMIDSHLGEVIDRKKEEEKRKRNEEQQERAARNRRRQVAEMRKLLSIYNEAISAKEWIE